MTLNHGSVANTQNRTKHPETKEAIADIFLTKGKYGFTPMIPEVLLESIEEEIMDLEGIVSFRPKLREVNVSLAIDLVAPKSQTEKKFLDDVHDLIDPLVPRTKFEVDFRKLALDYHERGIKSVGGVALLQGQDSQTLVIATPKALVEDPSLRYARDLSKMLPNPDGPRALERASTDLTAALIDTLLAGR